MLSHSAASGPRKPSIRRCPRAPRRCTGDLRKRQDRGAFSLRCGLASACKPDEPQMPKRRRFRKGAIWRRRTWPEDARCACRSGAARRGCPSNALPPGPRHDPQPMRIGPSADFGHMRRPFGGNRAARRSGRRAAVVAGDERMWPRNALRRRRYHDDPDQAPQEGRAIHQRHGGRPRPAARDRGDQPRLKFCSTTASIETWLEVLLIWGRTEIFSARIWRKWIMSRDRIFSR